MKRIFFIFIVLFIIVPLNSFALVSQSPNIYVTDGGDVLSYETEKSIVDLSNKLKKETGIDYYVVTIKNLDNLELEEYTDLVFEKFNISSNGILLLLSIDDRMIRIKVGEVLSNDIATSTIDGYIRMYFMPFFKRNEWDSGILNGYSSFYKLICDKNNIDSSDVVVYDDVDFVTKYKDIILIIIVWLNTIIAYVFCNYFINVYKKNFKLEIFDSILFIIVLIINILLLLFVYNINFISCLFVFLLELCAIYYNITSVHLDNLKNKKQKNIKYNNKTDKKNGDICYNKKQGGRHEEK